MANIRDIKCTELGCGAAAGEWCSGIKRSRRRGRSWHLLRAQQLRALINASAYDGRTLRERIADFNRR